MVGGCTVLGSGMSSSGVLVPVNTALYSEVPLDRRSIYIAVGLEEDRCSPDDALGSCLLDVGVSGSLFIIS